MRSSSKWKMDSISNLIFSNARCLWFITVSLNSLRDISEGRLHLERAAILIWSPPIHIFDLRILNWIYEVLWGWRRGLHPEMAALLFWSLRMHDVVYFFKISVMYFVEWGRGLHLERAALVFWSLRMQDVFYFFKISVRYCGGGGGVFIWKGQH